MGSEGQVSVTERGSVSPPRTCTLNTKWPYLWCLLEVAKAYGGWYLLRDTVVYLFTIV